MRKDFAARVVGDTEDVWSALFKAMGNDRYPPTTLSLYRGAVRSGCGTASSAAGPFYCPADQHVYLDIAFFDELARRFGAPGDFAQAYVIAHEVGHHVQNLTGIDAEVRSRRVSGSTSAAATRCRSASSCRPTATPACGATSRRSATCSSPATSRKGCAPRRAVGDDTIMKRTQGYVVPDAMNHGTAEQRTRWFRAGLAKRRPAHLRHVQRPRSPRHPTPIRAPAPRP